MQCNLKPEDDQVEVVAKVLRDGLEAHRLRLAGSLQLPLVNDAWHQVRDAVYEFLDALENTEGGMIQLPRRAPGERDKR